jgi:hypothetical protein
MPKVRVVLSGFEYKVSVVFLISGTEVRGVLSGFGYKVRDVFCN